MKRLVPAVLSVLALLGLPAAAQAKIVELGQTADAATPSCPTDCVAVARTTGYQAQVGKQKDLFVAPQDGRIVAWTITLAKPDPTQISYFDDHFGQAQAAISVLKPGRHVTGKLVAESPLESLTPFFGQTVQFPLQTTLPVKRGQIVALTVPSWAPALAVGLGKSSGWHAARPNDCNAKKWQTTQTAQTKIGAWARYNCLYSTARLAYSATLVTNPGH